MQAQNTVGARLVLSLFFGCLIGLTLSNFSLAETKTAEEKKPYEVSVDVSANTLIDDVITVGGILKPKRAFHIFPYNDGVVEKVMVFPGSHVEKGQTIFVIKPLEDLEEFPVQKIEAKASGVLLWVNVSEGEIVKKTQPIGLVADTREGSIRFMFSENDKNALESLSGIKIKNLPKKQGGVSVKLVAFNRLVDEETLAYTGFLDVKCEKNCENLFGKYLDIELIKSASKYVVVEKRAVNQRKNEVTIVNNQNRIEVRSVVIKKIIGEKIVLSSGLKAGEKTVLSAALPGWKRPKKGDQVVVKQSDFAGK